MLNNSVGMMSNLINELVEQAGFSVTEQNGAALKDFGERIVKHILEKMDTEIGLAYEQEENWTAATLEALALEILDDFDMEIDLDEDGEPE